MPYLTAREARRHWPTGYLSEQNIHAIAKVVQYRLEREALAENDWRYDVDAKREFRERFGSREEEEDEDG